MSSTLTVGFENEVHNVMKQLKSGHGSSLYGALIMLRTTLIKSRAALDKLLELGLIRLLIRLLEDEGRKLSHNKTIDIVMSILANLCMEEDVREKVVSCDGIGVVARVTLACEQESIQNRGVRALANLAHDGKNTDRIVALDVPIFVAKRLLETDDEECRVTFCRALRQFGQTQKGLDKLIEDTQAVQALAALLKLDSRKLAVKSLRILTEFCAKRCCPNFSGQILAANVLPELVQFAEDEDSDIAHFSFSLVLQLCEQELMRPPLGSAGVIPLLVKHMASERHFINKVSTLNALCLCTKEAVNRHKICDAGGLSLFITALRGDNGQLTNGRFSVLYDRIISSLVNFVYNEDCFGKLLECGLVSVLVEHLKRCCSLDTTQTHLRAEIGQLALVNDGQKHQDSIVKSGRSDRGVSGSSTLCLSPDLCDNEQKHSKEEILSAIDEGNEQSGIENEDPLIIDSSKATDRQGMVVEDSTDLPELPAVAASASRHTFSINSPTYQAETSWKLEDYTSGVTCKDFTADQETARMSPCSSVQSPYSPLSASSYYSPSQTSPGHSLSPSPSSPSSRSVHSQGSPAWSSPSSERHSNNSSFSPVHHPSAYCMSPVSQFSPLSNHNPSSPQQFDDEAPSPLFNSQMSVLSQAVSQELSGIASSVEGADGSSKNDKQTPESLVYSASEDDDDDNSEDEHITDSSELSKAKSHPGPSKTVLTDLSETSGLPNARIEGNSSETLDLIQSFSAEHSEMYSHSKPSYKKRRKLNSGEFVSDEVNVMKQGVEISKLEQLDNPNCTQVSASCLSTGVDKSESGLRDSGLTGCEKIESKMDLKSDAHFHTDAFMCEGKGKSPMKRPKSQIHLSFTSSRPSEESCRNFTPEGCKESPVSPRRSPYPDKGPKNNETSKNEKENSLKLGELKLKSSSLTTQKPSSKNVMTASTVRRLPNEENSDSRIKKILRTSESNILILLSRISLKSNPTSLLADASVIGCLLSYLSQASNPFLRCWRVLDRLCSNPLSFDKLILIQVPALIVRTLVLEQDGTFPVCVFSGECKNQPGSSNKMNLHSLLPMSQDSESSQTSELGRLMELEFGADAYSLMSSKHANFRQHSCASSDSQTTGELAYEPGCSRTVPRVALGLRLLRTLGSVAMSSYGNGEISLVLNRGSTQDQLACLVSLLYLPVGCGHRHTRHQFIRKFKLWGKIVPYLFVPDAPEARQAIVTAISLNLLLENPQKETKKIYQLPVCPDAPIDPQLATLSVHGNTVENVKNYEKNGLLSSCACCYGNFVDNYNVYFLVHEDKIVHRLGVNRDIIMRKSNVFAAMMGGSYLESSKTDIEIFDVHFSGFEFVVHYLHGCSSGCSVIDSMSYVKLAEAQSRVLSNAEISSGKDCVDSNSCKTMLKENKIQTSTEGTSICHDEQFSEDYSEMETDQNPVKSEHVGINDLIQSQDSLDSLTIEDNLDHPAVSSPGVADGDEKMNIVLELIDKCAEVLNVADRFLLTELITYTSSILSHSCLHHYTCDVIFPLACFYKLDSLAIDCLRETLMSNITSQETLSIYNNLCINGYKEQATRALSNLLTNATKD